MGTVVYLFLQGHVPSSKVLWRVQVQTSAAHSLTQKVTPDPWRRALLHFVIKESLDDVWATLTGAAWDMAEAESSGDMRKPHPAPQLQRSLGIRSKLGRVSYLSSYPRRD